MSAVITNYTTDRLFTRTLVITRKRNLIQIKRFKIYELRMVRFVNNMFTTET